MPLNVGGATKRPRKEQVTRVLQGRVLGPTGEKACQVVAKYTKHNPAVFIADPGAYMRSMLAGDEKELQVQPINGAESLAVSLCNILSAWFDSYNETPEMSQDYKVLAFWDCFKGLAANPLWTGHMGVALTVMPTINVVMMSYEAARHTELTHGKEGLAWHAETEAYVLILGALVDACSNSGAAAFAMRDLREFFEGVK